MRMYEHTEENRKILINIPTITSVEILGDAKLVRINFDKDNHMHLHCRDTTEAAALFGMLRNFAGT